MKNTVYQEEVKTAFYHVGDIVDSLTDDFVNFREYWDKLSKEEQTVIERFEKRFNNELMNWPATGVNFSCYESLCRSYKDLQESFEFDLDKVLSDGFRAHVDMDEVNDGVEASVNIRKKFIVNCAKFKQNAEVFRTELIEALNQAQVKVATQIAAPNQTTVVRQQNTSFLNRIKNTIVTVCRTVKRVVVNTVNTLKDKIAATIAAVKTQIATLAA